MKIEIKDAIPEDSGKIRIYLTIDDEPITSLLVTENNLINTNTLENAIGDQLAGKAFVGHTFTI